jgi:heme-degrading monooxygenase HmoA
MEEDLVLKSFGFYDWMNEREGLEIGITVSSKKSGDDGLGNPGPRLFESIGKEDPMAIRVVIERKVKEGKQAEMMNILRKLRTSALPRKGYISGETLRSRDDPSTYIVISSWQSVEDWEAWQSHPERTEISKKLEPLLATPEKYSIFVFVYP